MKTTLIFLAATLGLSASPVVTYQVQVNTSTIAGTSGNLDFQFNPGNATSQPAFVTIFGFASDGTLAGAPATVGDVTGTLPPAVTIHNTDGFNDYADGFTFGNALSFFVSFDGPAITSPNGTATAGSTFAFTLFNSDFSGTLLSTDPVNGVLVEGTVDTHGNVGISNFGVDSTTKASPVPEPASAGLALVGLLGVAIAIRGYRACTTSRH
jgi:hypothetical protein